jgi:anti-anti-sigma factor
LSDFSLSVSAAGPVVTVVIAGEVDLAEADRVWDELSPLITSGSTMLMDTSGVVFLDSSGLRSLLRLADWAGTVGAQFRLAAVSAPVRRVLELSGVGHVLAGPDEDSSAASAH